MFVSPTLLHRKDPGGLGGSVSNPHSRPRRSRAGVEYSKLGRRAGPMSNRLGLSLSSRTGPSRVESRRVSVWQYCGVLTKYSRQTGSASRGPSVVSWTRGVTLLWGTSPPPPIELFLKQGPGVGLWCPGLVVGVLASRMLEVLGSWERVMVTSLFPRVRNGYPVLKWTC